MYFNRVLGCYSLYRKRRCYQYWKYESQGCYTKPSLWVRLEMFFYRLCPSCLGGFRTSVSGYRPVGRFKLFMVKLMTNTTLENFIWKSAVGFISGVCFTYFLFLVFVAQLKISLFVATVICCLLGQFLSLGLAFSKKIRCCFLMTIPHLFSRKGRQALTAYALILSLSGPAKNTLRNTRVLSESLACGQELVKTNMKAIMELVKRPLKTIKETVKNIVDRIKEIVANMKLYLDSTKRLIYSLLSVIKYSHDWLNNIVSMCNKKVGTPYKRCMSVFDAAILDCKLQIGPKFDWLCSLANVASPLCYTVKFLDYMCEMFEFNSSDVVEKVERKLTEFSRRVQNIFYVSVDFTHEFSAETEHSRSLREIVSGIATEIRQRTDRVLALFNWLSFAFAFFFFLILFKVLYYRRKFLKCYKFDNHFITKHFIEIDCKRFVKHQETILPLLPNEKGIYTKLNSMNLLKKEKIDLVDTGIFLAIVTLKISLHMIADYSLWWLLNVIRKHGRVQTQTNEQSMVGIKVEGDDTLSKLMGSIMKMFEPGAIKMNIDTLMCLPNPFPPDISRYRLIMMLIGFTWLLAIMEPYGLRLRSVAMNHYYPDVARRRAVWLYNRILAQRCSMTKHLRRHLRKKYVKGVAGISKTSFRQRLFYMCPVLRFCMKERRKELCLLCKRAASKNGQLLECPKAGCVGVYCLDCFAQLGHMCTLCKQPAEYGDLSDISLERDSSSDDEIKYFSKGSVSDVELQADFDDPQETLIKHHSNLSFEYQNEERDPDDVPNLSDFPMNETYETNINYVKFDVLSSDEEESISDEIMLKLLHRRNITRFPDRMSPHQFREEGSNRSTHWTTSTTCVSSDNEDVNSRSTNLLNKTSLRQETKRLLENLKAYSILCKNSVLKSILGSQEKGYLHDNIPLLRNHEGDEVDIEQNAFVDKEDSSIDNIEKVTVDADRMNIINNADGQKSSKRTRSIKTPRTTTGQGQLKNGDEIVCSKVKFDFKETTMISIDEEFGRCSEKTSEDEIDLIHFHEDPQVSRRENRQRYLQEKSFQNDTETCQYEEDMKGDQSQKEMQGANNPEKQLRRGAKELRPWPYVPTPNPEKTISETLLKLKENKPVQQIKDKLLRNFKQI